MITLDTLTADYPDGRNADVIKVDPEGLELEILASGPKAVQSTDIVMLAVAFFESNEGQPKFVELVT